MRNLLLILSTFIFATETVGQTLSEPLGNMKSFHKNSDGISIQTDNGNLKVIVYSPAVIKIDITRNAAFNDFSYAVVAVPDSKTHFTVEETTDKITVTTDSLMVALSKKPVRIYLWS